jgi:hypothetical protein
LIVEDFGQEVLHPKTGLPVTTPLERLLILEGKFWLSPDKTKFQYEPIWLVRERRVGNPPEYAPFTLEDAEVLDKLCHEALVMLTDIKDALGLTHLRTLYRWIDQMKIPIYQIQGRYKVFSGDVVRAVSACRIPTEGTDGVAWRGYLDERADRTDAQNWKDEKRRQKDRAAGIPAKRRGRPPRREATGEPSGAGALGRDGGVRGGSEAGGGIAGEPLGEREG